MSLKERKQITGTTAQIDSYDGHEGQIVWDKDKKTFVGMSGTAGTNYPMATEKLVKDESSKLDTSIKTVDTKVTTEVSRLNASIDTKQPKGNYATTTEVTEGLSNKLDTGTVHIIETWKSPEGTSWYRKWSDGWIEQGGIDNAYESKSVTFSIPFLTSPLTINVAMRAESSTFDSLRQIEINTVTKEGFRFGVKLPTNRSISRYWEAKGY